MRQHRHLGRIGAEMRMQMLDAGRAQPLLNAASLGQVDEMHGQGTLARRLMRKLAAMPVEGGPAV